MQSGKSRRATDPLRVVDGLLEVHLQGTAEARPLANLAVAMAIDFSGAEIGFLLLDDGRGLVPVLALDDDLSRPGSSAGYDGPLVRRARDTRMVAADPGKIAAPILEAGRVRGVLYLQGAPARFDAETVDLVGAIATRIGTLLHSNELLAELARRTRNMGILEALGACLAAGSLTGEHLEEALEGAVRATRSKEGLLALLTSEGGLLQLRVHGRDEKTLRRLARDLAGRMDGRDGESLEELLGEGHLFEPLRPELVPADAAGAAPPAVGFLMVRESPTGYRKADRSFFKAVVHLLDGALARVDYFRKAAEDPLTQTGSRLALKLKLGEAQALSFQTGKPFSVILVDVDRFKEINDLYGHLAGDEVLQEVAGLLRSRLRADDSVARYGGDEFVIILPLTGSNEAAMLAGELRELAAASRLSEHGLEISLSMGVASSSIAGGLDDDILKRADQALYASKSGGRDRVTVAEG